jgi:hypothetical protein
MKIVHSMKRCAVIIDVVKDVTIQHLLDKAVKKAIRAYKGHAMFEGKDIYTAVAIAHHSEGKAVVWVEINKAGNEELDDLFTNAHAMEFSRDATGKFVGPSWMALSGERVVAIGQ